MKQLLNKHFKYFLNIAFLNLDFEKYIPRTIYSGDETQYNSRSESLMNVSISDGSVSNNNVENFFSFETKESSMKNPFKTEEKSDFENLEFALQILDDQSARMNPSSYNVTSQEGKIVKVSLNKNNYKIGDKLIISLDFSDSSVQCLEFKVTLQSEEITSEECRKKSNQPLSSIHSHSEIKEYCLYMKKTDVTIQIPVHITPAFVSDIRNKIIFNCLFLSNDFNCVSKIFSFITLAFTFRIRSFKTQHLQNSTFN
jgi:hypothetical protein